MSTMTVSHAPVKQEEPRGGSAEALDDFRNTITVVANRLPVHEGEDGRYRISPGGLVSALTPIVREASGNWLGWSGKIGAEGGPLHIDDLNLIDIPMSEQDYEEYYCQFSNQVLWPLFHDGVRQPPFSETGWEGYKRVNERFARATAEIVPEKGCVWIQDYHLLLMPGMLRQLRPDLQIGLFLHIPLPPAELFATIPWREQLVGSMLQADLIGTQTPIDATHLRAILTEQSHYHDEGESSAEPGVEIDAFPISIESSKFDKAARAAEVSGRVEELGRRLANGRCIYLGVDRLDYTKGIDLRLLAFEQALEQGDLDPAKVCFVQVAVPSRETVTDYKEIGEKVDMLVGRINGRFGGINGPVVHYIKESLDFEYLIDLYRAADVMVVTPVRDGMNLVAKEFVATRYDATGELILSEFAGTAHEFTRATIVNPHDQRGLAEALSSAYTRRGSQDNRLAMRAMHEQVMEFQVRRWARSFIQRLQAAAGDQHRAAAGAPAASLARQGARGAGRATSGEEP